MNSSKLTTIILCTVLGLATVLFAARSRSLQRQLQRAEAQLQSPGPALAPPPNRDLARLRKLLDERETAYIQLETAYRQLLDGQAPTSQPTVAALPIPTDRPAASVATTNQLSWLDRLKQDDPERYQQLVTQREQRRKAADQWFQEQVTALDQRAQTAPTRQEAELATKIADTLSKINDLRQQFQAARELPDDQRTEAFQQLQAQAHEANDTLRALGQQDRQMQLQNLARTVGYTSNGDVQSFVTAIGSIYKNTDYHPGHGMDYGGGGGGGGGGGRSPVTANSATAQPRRKSTAGSN